MKDKLFKIVLAVFFLFGIAQPLYSLSKILVYGQLFEYNFTYLRAAFAFLSGKSLYSFGDINYPPTTLFLFVPLSFLPIFPGQIIFSLASIASLILAIVLVVKSLNLKLSLKERLFILPLIFLSFPVKWTLGLGQINNLILLLIVLSFYFFRKRKEVLSGVSLGLAGALKITPGLLMICFLINKRFKVFMATVVTLGLLFLSSGLVFGFNLISEYFLKVVPGIFCQGSKGIYYNQAFSGFLGRLTMAERFQSLGSLVLVIIIFLIIFSVLKREKNVNALSYSLVISTILLINSFSWQHHFVWLLFPFLTVLGLLKSSFSGRDKKLISLWSIASYVLISYNIKQPQKYEGTVLGRILLSHVFLGNFLLFVILIYLIKQQRRSL